MRRSPSKASVVCPPIVHCYNWCDKLEVFDQNGSETRIAKQPLAERAIKSDIPILVLHLTRYLLGLDSTKKTPIRDGWTMTLKKRSIEQHCDKVRLKLHGKYKRGSRSEILIAGCGTGQHSVEQAVIFWLPSHCSRFVWPVSRMLKGNLVSLA